MPAKLITLFFGGERIAANGATQVLSAPRSDLEFLAFSLSFISAGSPPRLLLFSSLLRSYFGLAEWSYSLRQV